jgi:hypothetical protein
MAEAATWAVCWLRVTVDRLGVVLRTIADTESTHDASVIDRVCFAAVLLLSVNGAGLSLMVDGQLQGTAGVSDASIAAVQELQLSLGEGPCVDAWELRAVVMEPDLAAPAGARWPAFRAAAVTAGVGAVFAFPMALGAIRLGVLVLYRASPGALSSDEVAYGIVLAEVATQVTLGLQAGATADTLHALLASEPGHWAEVHQATGMLSVQLGVPLDEAFVRLRAHAFALERPLRDVARAVVAGHLRLDASR